MAPTPQLPQQLDPISQHLSDQLKVAGIDHIQVRPNRLAGGVISFVYEGVNIEDGTPVVLKYTEDRDCKKPPFNERVDHFISRDGHNDDARILEFLKDNEEPECFTVPSISHHLPEAWITVMPDLRAPPYEMTLFSTDLKTGISKSGYGIGFAIAMAQIKVQTLTGTYTPNERPEDQFHERGEVLLHNNRGQADYLKFMRLHCDEDNPLILTDMHPKNIFFGLGKEISFIDFGRTTTGDPDFVLPNFCSHILLNVIIGNIPSDEGINYVRQAIAGYRAAFAKSVSYRGFNNIDEAKFIFFTAAEVLNRHKGKFVDYFNGMDVERKSASQNALNTFANILLDGQFDSIELMLELAKAVSQDVKTGKYSHSYSISTGSAWSF